MEKLIVAGALLLVAIVIYSFVSGNKEAPNTESNIRNDGIERSN